MSFILWQIFKINFQILNSCLCTEKYFKRSLIYLSEFFNPKFTWIISTYSSRLISYLAIFLKDIVFQYCLNTIFMTFIFSLLEIFQFLSTFFLTISFFVFFFKWKLFPFNCNKFQTIHIIKLLLQVMKINSLNEQ